MKHTTPFIYRHSSHLLHQIALILSKHYFRVEIQGSENLPDQAALLVGNHNASPFLPDTQALAVHYRFKNVPRKLKMMTHDESFKMPILGQIIKDAGAISCQAQSGKQALLEGHHVLIYPGGGWDSCRPSKERDQITFKNREGYLKIALETGAPIIPVVAAGAHDGWWVFTRGDRIANFFGLQKFKIDTFPIAFALPFGFAFGPIFPFFPLPRKILISILPAIDPKTLLEQCGTTNQASKTILELMQKEMNRLVQQLPRSKSKR